MTVGLSITRKAFIIFAISRAAKRRPTSIREPELYAQGQSGAAQGTTTFTYAYNSTGLLMTRKKPKANQASATTLTTTATQYDSLGRVVSVTYDDGLTPNKQFDYDTVNSSMQWTPSSTNLKGRLADTASGTGTSLTRDLFSYDAMGRVVNIWQCAPSICGGSSQASRPLSFSYDLAGNLLSETDSTTGKIVYTRSVANEVTSITNDTYTGTGNPSALVSGVMNGPNGPVSYNLGNGLSTNYLYDSVGRLNGGYVCNGSVSPNCSGGSSQLYGFYVGWKGALLTASNDTILNQGGASFGYDEFNRLTSQTISTGNIQNFTYTYDRYGNRWQQTLTKGPTAPQPSHSFNSATNQITDSGYVYDAAGNLLNDTIHTYKYDAEGNILSVDANGATGLYVYDALNHRVRTQTASATNEYIYDASGKRTSTWQVSSNFGIEGRIYWDGRQVAYRAQDGNTYFDHQDWLGTERLRTTYTGTVAGSFTSLAWGDGYSPTVTGQGGEDGLHFASLDYDAEDGNSNAQFREYSNAQGRWMRPDPYYGSYDSSNPQSMNRYAYVLNNPLALIDPLGLDNTQGNEPFYDAGTGCWEIWDNETNTLSIISCGSQGGGPNGSGGGGGSLGGGGGTAPSNKPPTPTMTPEQQHEARSFAITASVKTLTVTATANGVVSLGAVAVGTFVPITAPAALPFAAITGLIGGAEALGAGGLDLYGFLSGCK